MALPLPWDVPSSDPPSLSDISESTIVVAVITEAAPSEQPSLKETRTTPSESFFGSPPLSLSLATEEEILVPFELGAKIGVLKPHSRRLFDRHNCRDGSGGICYCKANPGAVSGFL